MNHIISIIVPIYNREKSLDKCVESVLRQSFTDWELILVDDGSRDASYEVCKQYSRKDPRIKTFHQENQGANAARFLGYQKSNGDYITFLDSDDTLPITALADLYSYAVKGYDIVKGIIDIVDENEQTIDFDKTSKLNMEILGRENYMLMLFTDKIPPYLWGGLYKRTLFSDEVFTWTIKYKLCLGEDFVSNAYLADKTEKVIYIDRSTYLYYANPNGTMNTSVFGRTYSDRVDGALKELLSSAPMSVCRAYYIKRTIGMLKSFFVPELKFSHACYMMMKKNMSNDYIAEGVETLVDKKFILFVSLEPLFYVYTYFYRILFRYKKLHGKVRKVIE